MVNYSQAKVYKIVDNTNGNIYVGSTCEPTLARRLAGHVGAYKRYLNGKCNNYTSFQILANNDYNIVLLEACENITTKDELCARERFYIETLTCINKVIPLRTGKEWRELNKEYLAKLNKEWRENNKDKLKAYLESNKEARAEKQKAYELRNKDKKKSYLENNKDKRAKKQKEYIEANKEKYDAYHSQYREKNKDKINTYQKEYREANRDKLINYLKEYRIKKKQSKELPVEEIETQLN